MEHVYYINLEKRTDRKKHVEKQLNALGWNYKCFKAVETKNGRLGCSMSHLKLLQTAKENNLPHIVILEDDIHFTDIPMFKRQYKHFIDKNIHYDVLLLGGNLRKPVQKISPHILKISKSFTTTGYIVKQHYYDIFINNIKQGINLLLKNLNNVNNGMYAIDVHWMQLQRKDNWYILYPRTISQLPDYSDIEKKTVNYNHVMLD